MAHIVWTCPLFFKGGGGGGGVDVNFKYLPGRGEYEKLKKGGGSMVLGQVFLKGGGACAFSAPITQFNQLCQDLSASFLFFF